MDIRTLCILEDYLDDFQGILIVVSHDRYFLDRVADRLFVYNGDGTISQFEGSYTDYYLKYGTFANSVKSGNILSISDAIASKSTNNGSGKKSACRHRTKKNPSKETAPKRPKTKLSYKEQREYDTIETDIMACEEQIDNLEKKKLPPPQPIIPG